MRPVSQTERITAADAPQHEIDSRSFAIVTDLVGTPSELVDEHGDIAWRIRSTLREAPASWPRQSARVWTLPARASAVMRAASPSVTPFC
jgi:hypothetical protein